MKGNTRRGNKNRSFYARKKTRKGRKQQGGVNMQRIRRNVIAASKLGASDDSNLYFTVSEDDITKGHALVIAPRYTGVKDAEIKAAKYPYEECLFFFDINMGGEAPNDYPNGPPQLKHQTPAIFQNYRLHPNLYENFDDDKYSGKVCLGILGTWGNNDWKSSMSISDVLQGIMGILEANPGTYEPGCKGYTDKQADGILYNIHVLYESISVSCKAYAKVFKALKMGANNTPRFENANIARETIPPFMKPFLGILAKRGFSALNYLIGKIDEFIRVNGNKTKFTLNDAMHHKAKTADFGQLKASLEAVKATIPKALQKNIFKYGIGETHRALFELSKPTRKNGTRMTYEEFVEEIQDKEALQQEAEKDKKKAELGVNSCSIEQQNEKENETSYVYNNNDFGNIEQNNE